MQDPAATMQDYHPQHHAQTATDFGALTGGSAGGIPMSPGAGSDPVQSPQPMSPVSGPVSPVSPMSPGALSPRVVDGLPTRPALLDSFGKSVGRIQGILHDTKRHKNVPLLFIGDLKYFLTCVFGGITQLCSTMF